MIIFFAIPLFLFSIFWRPLFYAALILEGGYLIMRGMDLGRLPLVGLHDTLVFLAFSTGIFSLPFLRAERRLMPPVAVLAMIFTILGVLSGRMDAPLPQVLRTYWFEFHVVLSFFSYGLFGTGAVLGVLYLRSGQAGAEALQYRALLIGYLLFSLSMIAGGIWAFYAWGRYWLWTPKELWTTLLWLHYTLYLHLRYIGKWKGRRAAIFGVAGYGVVLFTYLGVGLLMKSSHSF